MAKDVKFNIKLNVDGKDVVVQASTNVQQLADKLGVVVRFLQFLNIPA